MGAFILYPTNTDVEKAQLLFEQKGFCKPLQFSLGLFNLLLYPKIVYPQINHFAAGNDMVICVGTFLYKGQQVLEGLQSFYYDFCEKRVDSNSVQGTFSLVLYVNGALYLTNDDENLYPVYVNHNKKIVSSSFLAIAEQLETLSLNRLSVIENLITGCSFGFDTYFNEIKRIRWGNEVNLPQEIQYLPLSKKSVILSKPNKKEAYSLQQQALAKWFNTFSSFANQHGCEVGLSSGYDSRLLLALCLNHFNFNKVNVGSNHKNPPDDDLRTARRLAQAVNKDCVEIPVVPTKDMTTEQLEHNFRMAFLFYDGQIRTNHGWSREYRTAHYRKKVLGVSGLGLSGHAGEMLRNDFNLDRFRFSYNKWILNNIIGKSGQQRIGNNHDLLQLVSYIKSKLKHIVDTNRKFININDVHRYYNEAWVQSGPGIRTSIENQLSYYASPFTDYNVSKTAYNLIHFLDDARFEKRLINENCGDVAAVPYEIKNREFAPPFLNTTITYRLGIDIRHIFRMHIKKRNQKLSANFKKMIKKHKFLQAVLNNPKLNELIPVDSYISNCGDEAEQDRFIAFAFVLHMYSKKL
ncbi:MAG: hypothetical protein KGZ97_10820 [Bacteroidetes bacterium]|nr:hypothetical protein [Bacteroidota bacterium]